MTKLLPLSEAALLCEHTAQVARETAHLPLREPECDIDEFDRQRGTTDLADPLRTAHRMAQFYLVGAGDFLYSIGTLLALDQPTVISPAVLARSTGEYASRAKYLSSPDDGPEMRISKVWTLIMDGFTRMGASKPYADPAMVEMVKRLERWRSGQTLPKSKVPDYTKLIEHLSPQMGRDEYESLSQLVHANALRVTITGYAAASGHRHHHENAWRQVLFATECALLAAREVCDLRDGDKRPLTECLEFFHGTVGAYNSYLETDGAGA
ncbi:hypothetical protein [Nocardia salmonicida]|uniref:hypothetical protein n=1 Tax=Nocardia salmonicida TaxID=53431 RepID=UPI0037A97DB1